MSLITRFHRANMAQNAVLIPPLLMYRYTGRETKCLTIDHMEAISEKQNIYHVKLLMCWYVRTSPKSSVCIHTGIHHKIKSLKFVFWKRYPARATYFAKDKLVQLWYKILIKLWWKVCNFIVSSNLKHKIIPSTLTVPQMWSVESFSCFVTLVELRYLRNNFFTEIIRHQISILTLHLTCTPYLSSFQISNTTRKPIYYQVSETHLFSTYFCFPWVFNF